MATDILNSLGYRKIKDTYHSVLFVDNDDKLNESPTIYNGDGVIMPFTFSTNNIAVSSTQLSCINTLECVGNKQLNVNDTLTTRQLYVQNLQLNTYNNILENTVQISQNNKNIITNDVVFNYCSSQFVSAIDMFNNIQSDLEYVECVHKLVENGNNSPVINFKFDVKSYPTHYLIIITTIKVYAYEDRATISMYLNNKLLQQTYMCMAVSSDYSGGGHIPISFIYTLAPNSDKLDKFNNNTLNFSSNNNQVKIEGITDLMILHGSHI